MPIEMPDDINAQIAAERILDDPSLRDELTDDEAQQLIDWGVAQAVAAAERHRASADEAALDDELDKLHKFIKRINNFAAKRSEDDAERVRKRFDWIASLSAELFGQSVTLPDDAEIDDFLAGQAAMDNRQFVQKLLAMLTPQTDA